MRFLFYGDNGPLDIRALSTALSYALLLGAALGILSVSWGWRLYTAHVALRRRVLALEAQLAGLSDRT